MLPTRKGEKMEVAVEGVGSYRIFCISTCQILERQKCQNVRGGPGEVEEICQLYCRSSDLSVWRLTLYGWIHRHPSIWPHRPRNRPSLWSKPSSEEASTVDAMVRLQTQHLLPHPQLTPPCGLPCSRETQGL